VSQLALLHARLRRARSVLERARLRVLPCRGRAREAAAAARLFALLPADRGEQLQALWHEFESGRSMEARFARAIDRLQPMLLNGLNDGGTWRDYAVGETQLRARTGHIAHGADALWAHCEVLIAEAIEAGWLTASTAGAP